MLRVAGNARRMRRWPVVAIVHATAVEADDATTATDGLNRYGAARTRRGRGRRANGGGGITFCRRCRYAAGRPADREHERSHAGAQRGRGPCLSIPHNFAV